MLTPASFADALKGDAIPKGWLAVISLATFKPIGDLHGIPAVQQAREYLGELVVQSAPAGAIVGAISWTGFAVSLPGATLDDMASFVAAVRSATLENDLELKRGTWVEIRVAVGVAEIHGDEPSTRRPLEAAAHGAQLDLARFPADWDHTIDLSNEMCCITD